MRNFVDSGDLVTITAPSALLTGTPVQVGSVFGVAHSNAAAGSQVALRVRGRYVLPKLSAAVLRAGTVACWTGSTIGATGRPVGYVSEDALAGSTSVTVLLTGTNPAFSEQQQRSVADLVQRAPALVAGSGAAAGDALIWWPLRESVATASSTPTITDHSGQLIGAYAGGTRRWGPWPGLAFDAGAYLPMNGGAMSGKTMAARRCGNLASLTRGVDQITIFGVMSHPAPITGPTDRTLLSWGATESAKGGWSVGLGGSRERFYTVISPQASSRTLSACRTEVAGDKLTGMAISPAPAYLNTLSAFAIEFVADTAGFLVCNTFFLPISTGFGIELKYQGYNSLALVPSGSGGTAASTDDVDAGFTIGARATTNATTVADSATALSLLQLGICRHRFDFGLGARLVRDLRAAPRNFPRNLASLLGDIA